MKKAFIHLAHNARPQLRGEALVGRRFLPLLEPGLPNHLLCYGCNGLYNWRPSLGGRIVVEIPWPGRRHGSNHLHQSQARLCVCHNAWKIQPRVHIWNLKRPVQPPARSPGSHPQRRAERPSRFLLCAQMCIHVSLQPSADTNFDQAASKDSCRLADALDCRENCCRSLC